MPTSRSIQGNAFSWPMARMTSSAGRMTLSSFSCLSLPFDFQRAEALELHADELAVVVDEAHRRVVLEDLDLLLLGVLELPRRGLEVLARLAPDDAHGAGAEPLGRAAAVHRRVADADDEDVLADRGRVPEVDRLEPVDADVHVVGRVVAAGDVEVLAARRARADEHGVEAAVVEERLERLDRRRVLDLDAAHLEDVAALLVEDLGRQAERRDVGAHQAARAIELLEDGDRVAERRQVVGHGQRRRAGADERHALAVLLRRRLGQELRHIVAIVAGDALEAADGDRLAVDAAATARRLARPIAGAPEDAREHVRAAIEEVRFGEAPLGDQPDVLGDVGVRRTSPLAVDNLVVVARIGDVRGLHRLLRRGNW